MIRIDKFLSEMGIASRSETTRMIKSGKISCNGDVVKSSSYKVHEENDVITVSGEEISYKKNFYIMLNKPTGYITATEDNFNKTVMDLIDDKLIKNRVSPAGRLDIDTEGFVFLTDDGKMNHYITGPKNHVKKEYLCHLKNPLTDNDICKLEEGVMLDDGYITKKSDVRKINDKECFLSISEGKFHQVKRMFESVNNKILYLKRTKIGNLSLDLNLKPGEYREINEDELLLLQELKRKE